MDCGYGQITATETGSETAERTPNRTSRTRIRSGTRRVARLGYREEQVLALVRERIASVGMAPSYTEICSVLGISSREKVNRIVVQLEKRGLLSRVGGGKCPRTVHCARVRRITLGIGA